MKPVILEGSGITKKFEEADTPVLNNVNIELYDGDFTVIMGASGAGKSTLLYSLSGMNTIDEGKILYTLSLTEELVRERVYARHAGPPARHRCAGV